MSSDLTTGGKPAWVRILRLRVSKLNLRAIAVVVAIPVVAMFLWQLRDPNSPRAAAARATYRPIQGRLAEDFPFKPYHPNRRVMAMVPDGAEPRERALGLLLALKLDAAIAAYESLLPKDAAATRDDPATDAGLLTNLASALSERAQLQSRPGDFAPALAAVSRAMELTPTRAAPRHVYASILEALPLREDAIEAWEAYLRIDPDSSWSAEARTHLAALHEATAVNVTEVALREAFARGDARALASMGAVAPQLARTLSEDDFLGRWGRAIETSDSFVAVATMASLRVLASSIQKTGSDRTLTECLARIESATPAEARRLATAHRMYADARKVAAKARDENAENALLRAHEALRDAGSPLQWRALIHVASVMQTRGEQDEALRITASVVEALAPRRREFAIAMGQALWVRGQVEYARGLPHAALQSFLEARDVFGNTAETANVGAMETWVANCYRYVGDSESAWNHYVRALTFLRPDTPYDRRQVALSDAAHAAALNGDDAFARLVARRIGKNAASRNDAIYAAQALHLEGLALSARGRWDDAERLLQRAAAILGQQAQTPAIVRQSAFIAAARAEALVHTNPEAAIRHAEEAIEQFREQQYQARLLRLHLYRGRAWEQLGDLAAAETAFREGIAEVARQRAGLPTDEERSTFTDTARALYDELVTILVKHSDFTGALAVVRSARTIGLTSPGTLLRNAEDHTRTSVAPGTTLIEYYVLPDRLLMWSSVGEVRHFVQQPMPAVRLERQLEQFVAAIQSCDDPEACKAEASSLFELLLRRVAGDLRAGNDLVIAPDGPLHRVPFSALYDRSANRFIARAHAVVIALGNEPSSLTESYRSIFVAAPDAADRSLPRLPMARTEAQRTAAQFLHSTVLPRGAETTERVLHEAAEHDVFHFAGHAAWNERQPRFSALLMAADGNRPNGALYAYEVSNHRFDRTRLVVLAACDSARGRISGLGLLGIARAFTAAGVPRVVGSLWPVDDAESARLFQHFYSTLARDGNVAHALQHAQQEMLATSHGPAAWAAYQIYSGNER